MATKSSTRAARSAPRTRLGMRHGTKPSLPMARVAEAIGNKNWMGALRAVAPIARQTSLTPSERRTVLVVSRRAYDEAEKAYRRGDRRVALQLARALRRIPGPYAQRAAELEMRIQRWLRSQRKGRSSVLRPKKKSVGAKKNGGTGRASAPPRRRGGRSTQGPARPPELGGPLIPKGAGRGRARPRRARSNGTRKPVVDETRSTRQTVVRRNPHMKLSVPEPLPLGGAFDVDIWADEHQASAGELTEPITVAVPEDVQHVVLSVTLLVTPHFRVDGDTHKDLVVPRDRPESDHVTFVVRVHAEDLPLSQPELTAIFTYNGRAAGKVVRQPAIAGFRPQPPTKRRLAFAPEAEVVPAAEVPLPIVDMQVDAITPDLTISILDTAEKDGRHYHMIVNAAGQHWEGPWVLPKRSDELVKTAMDVFVQSDETGTGTTGRIAALTGAGIDMFEATPPEFRKLFWDLVDKRKPKTILIISEEPYIPWELMVPTRWLNGRREDREPLGVEFAVGRWINRQYVSPPQKMSFKLTFVVAPRYSSDRRLRHAEREAKLVAKSFPPSRRIDPASLTTLDESVADQDVTLLHFVCHGKAEAPQTIYMDNEEDNLNCLQVKALKGFLHTFPRARTFVFLNACEVGRPAPALVGIGGLANEFLAIGAGGVVAPLWSVADDVAFDVAKEFYETTRKSPKTSFARILQAIRKKAYTGTAEDTWAAYCFYGDPKASLSV
jgi:hypothetical protein